MKEMETKSILGLRPTIGFDGYSVISVVKIVRVIRLLVWYFSMGRRTSVYIYGLASFIESFVKSVTGDEMERISLLCCDKYPIRRS